VRVVFEDVYRLLFSLLSFENLKFGVDFLMNLLRTIVTRERESRERDVVD